MGSPSPTGCHCFLNDKKTLICFFLSLEGKVWFVKMKVDARRLLLAWPEAHSVGGNRPPHPRSGAAECKLREDSVSPILFCNRRFILGNLFVIAVEV